MFSSLKHSARRKILRILSEKPITFSELLDSLGVSSSHLTYHLENLGELVSKTDDGKYRLSSFGVAAVKTMTIVEDKSPDPKHGLSLSLRWKSVFAILFVGVLLLASMSYVQYASLNQLSKDYDHLEVAYDRLLSWNTGTDSAISFLRDVAQIDISQYQATLLSDTVDHRSDLGGVVEEIIQYSLASDQGTADVVFRFRDNKLSRYQLNLFEGPLIFGEPQPSDMLEATRGLLARLKSFRNTQYLDDMDSILSSINEFTPMEVTQGNVKLEISVSGGTAQVLWLYTENGVDFSAKSLRFLFDNRVLKEVTDGWFLFSPGSTEVDVTKEEAIRIAKDYVKGFSWEYQGTVISNFVVVDDPVTAEFAPHPREEPLKLIPFWFVTLYLDKVYPGEVNRIGVGLWGDTGEVDYVKAMSG
jgi:hypothetical protein